MMDLCKKYLLAFLTAATAAPAAVLAQCPTTNIAGNLSPANGDTLSGTYIVSGNFIVAPGVTVNVRPFRSGGCGELVVIAGGNIQIDGSINANAAGYNGATGGALGTANNISFIESCPAPTDQCGAVITFGGGPGAAGNPGGGGNGGAVGLDGSGRKNQCFNFSDEGGRIGGAGGAGGGAGGSYGGAANAGAAGGAGTLPTVNATVSSCTSQVFAFGFGGNGGTPGSSYGTTAGSDIDKGSAGAGAGGGGRGRFAGTAGAQGGAGGGLVRLESGGDLVFTGSIQANGAPGGAGGNGGNAGPSPRCCSDGCDGVDEYTHTGAGGAGGGAGGGSGGGVLLKAGGIATITGSISANGADGGPGGAGGATSPNLSLGGGFFCSTTTATYTGGSAAGQGGAGAGGRIKVFFNPCAPGNVVFPTTTTTGGNGNGGAAAAGTTHVGPDGSFAVGASQPAAQTVCYLGDPGNLNALPASGGYGPITYQWQASVGCTGLFANIPGANSLNHDPAPGITDTTCYRLLVTTGTCAAYTDTLQVNVIPPQGAAINPAGPLAACIGDTLLLQTSGGAGAAYQWLYNGIPIPAAIDSFYLATTTGAYTVQIAYPVGCAGLSPATTVQFDPPPAAFAAAQGDTILCPGQSVALSGFGQGAFQWELNHQPIAGATGATLTATQPGTYTLAVTTAGGCTATSDSVVITPGVAANAGLSAGGPLAFCAGDSVVLSGSGGTLVQWLQAGLTLPGATSNPLTVHSSGVYAVVVASATGCRDTSAALTVISDTVVAGLVPAQNAQACLGDSALFLASGGGSYAWLFDQQPIPDTTNFLFAITQGDYTVIVTSVHGCVDTSATFTFTNYPPVFPTASALGDPFLCDGESVLLLGSAPGGISYQWAVNDTVIPGATTLNYNAGGPGVYALYAYDQYGCRYSSPFFSLYPGAEPQAEIQPLDPLPFCPGQSVMLLGTGGDSLWWYRDGVLIASGMDTLVTSVPGAYMFATETACGTDSSGILVVEQTPGPTAGFYGNNLPAQQVEFVDQSISGATWLWDFGDGSPTVTQQNPVHTFPGPGTYTITMITWDIFGCSDTVTLAFEVMDPLVFIPNVFSPNGDGNNDVAETNFNVLQAIDFRIYDRWGREMFRTSGTMEYWDGTRNGKPAPDGVYYYHLRAQDPQDRDVEAKGYMTLLR